MLHTESRVARLLKSMLFVVNGDRSNRCVSIRRNTPIELRLTRNRYRYLSRHQSASRQRHDSLIERIEVKIPSDRPIGRISSDCGRCIKLFPAAIQGRSEADG